MNEKSSKPAILWCLLPIILFAGWLPHIIGNYPGSVCFDASSQLSQFLGFTPLSNHNPVLDTWIYGCLFQLGRFLFGSDNAGIACITVTQFLLMSVSYAYLIFIVYSLTKRKLVVVISCAFYILVPIFGGAGQCVLKDTLHTAFFIGWFAFQIDLLRRPPSTARVLFYVLLACLTALTRSAAVAYIVAGFIGMILLCDKAQKQTMCAALVTTITVVLLFQKALLPLLGIAEYPTVDKYSLPIQQIAYVVKNNELSDEDVKIVNEFYNVDSMRADYNPSSADPLKAPFLSNNDKEMPRKLLRCYAHLWNRYPADMLRSIWVSYSGYLSPKSIGNGNYRSYIMDCSSIGLDIHYTNETARKRIIEYDRTWEYYKPILAIFMGPGLYTLLFLICMVIGCIRWKWKYFLLNLPLFVLFIGLFLTAINGEVRYAYPIIAATPWTVGGYSTATRRRVEQFSTRL